ncbi:MAG TPA: outer membrane beta-barrel protein, partial [Chitinophagaceae bacterium]
LKGYVLDTSEKKPLPFAVISLLHKKDSTLATFTRANKSGYFQFNGLAAGKYTMMISYPRFADFVDDLELKDPVHDLNNIPLTHKSLLLKEVIIRSGQAIRIKGDTTEFAADSFVVKDGATVEDLLKKLPGFQVNARGEITAHGKRVEKVLVDGEEFFGDDPTMATQNLSARVVDKVQVYDTKSEQQQLTGITSGNEGKTINIKLKEDKKKGAFGKIYAGTDFNEYSDAKALYNKFVGKKKVSLYGTKSSLSTGSLNWEERQKLGIEEDMEYDEIGGYYTFAGTDDGFNDWNLRGLPDSYTAGGLFSNKWNGDKQNVNLSYRYNRLGTENTGATLAQYLRAGTIDYRNVSTRTSALNEQHQGNAKYEWKVDSLTSFKISVNGLRRTSDQYATTNTEFLDEAKELRNNSSQQKENHTERLQSDNVLTYKQLFHKKNRQMITTLRFGVTEDDSEGTLHTELGFFGARDSASTVDQMKLFAGRSQTIGGKITFSEPLTDKFNVVLDYGHNRNHSYSHRNTYNKGSNGKYEVLDPLFSNNFDFDALSHSSQAVLRYVDKKVRFALGSGLSAVNLDLYDTDAGKKTAYNFLRVTPQGQFNYTFKPQMGITFNYRGTTRQPNINQLQPLRDNTDPLYEYRGNPDLEVGFNHSFSTFFNQYKVLSRRSVWVNVSYNVTNNAVVNSTTFDPATRKQTTMPVNVDGVKYWYFNGNWNKGGGEKKLGYGIRLNANGGRTFNFVDAMKNTNEYTNLRGGVSLEYDVPEKGSFEIRPEVGYNHSRASLNRSVNNNYFTYGGALNGFIMLPGKVELRSDVNFDLRQRISAFNANTNIIQWNASLAKKVFKDKSGKLFLITNDLLDQNRGFTRNINSNFIIEDRYSRVSQYFLLKFEWSFTKMPGAK